MFRTSVKNPVGRSSKKWWKFLFNFLTNICIINGFVLYDHFNQVEKKKKRYTQLDFRINLVANLIYGYSFTKKRIPALVVFPMNISSPTLHRHTRLKRKKSICKFCTKHGEKRKETIRGCDTCFECHRGFHAVIGVVVMEE